MVQTIIPPPCCCEDCDDVAVPSVACFEVFAPGQDPDTDLPVRWIRYGSAPYAERVVLSCNQLPVGGLLGIVFAKTRSCGPYELRGYFGEDYSPGPVTYNDLNWFEPGNIGRIEDPEGGIWLIRRCEYPYYWSESPYFVAGPTCLTVSEDEVDLDVNSGGTDLCGFLSNHADVTSCEEVIAGTYVVVWQVDPTQRDITITYCNFFGSWSVTIPWTRNWWLTTLTLTGGDAEHGTTRTLTDCSTPCDPGCYPECLKCPAAASLALAIEEDPSCCVSGTFDLTYDSGANEWTREFPDTIGGPGGVCGLIVNVRVSCGADADHVRLYVQWEDVNGNVLTINEDVACTCEPSFETDYVSVPSNPFAPGLCDGGFFRGSRLRVIAV